MDKNEPNYNFQPYMNYEMGYDGMTGDPNLFNPIMQYEQGYMYYRYLAKQMEYKIKCKEYEKLCVNNKNDRRIE